MKNSLLLFLLINLAGYAQKPVFTNANVKAATVYYNGAELTQQVNFNLPSGSSELVVSNVADNIDESSVRVAAPQSVTILSVQFTRNYVNEYEADENPPALKKVRDSINILEKEIEKVRTARATEAKNLQLLDDANGMYGRQVNLSVAELMKMVEYYKLKRNQTATAINNLTTKEQRLLERVTILQAKLEVNTAVAEKTSTGKLVLQIMNTTAGPVAIDVSYLTPNASWRPFYDLRAESTATPINLMYKAQVTQQTGVDWKKARLTLSSGTPVQNNQMPLLQAWFLQYGEIYRDMGYSVQNSIRGISSAVPQADVSYAIKDKASVSAYTTVTENQLSISFDIDLPYDILSNGKAHSVSMKELQLPASYRHYTVPKMETAAFLMAELSDYSKYNLLPGEANIIFENMYIGKTYIDPNQTTDTLNLSMGRDRKISVKREKVAEKSGTKFLSSYREQTFTYDITIRNNKKEAAHVTVKDQYPVSTDKDTEVELLQSDKAKVNIETGILTWEIDLKPGETKKIRLSYRVKHPKDRPLSNL